jgi:hypothetical protein
MSLNFSLIQDVYGCEYTELNGNSNKNKHNTSLEQEMVAESNRELQEMEAGIEGFANYQGGNSIDTGMAQIISEESFTRKPKKSKKNKKNNKNKLQRPKAVVPTPAPQARQEEDSSSDEESDVEPVENTSNNKKLVNENIQLKRQIDELDTKLNLLINKLNTDTKTNNKTETNNIYDIILFVIFGLFVLLLLESLTKLISKNIVKYEPSNAIKAIME